MKNNYAVYGSNDDALIANFSIDSNSGTDRDNWISIDSLISIPLTLLQEYLGDFGIYGIFLATINILSISALFSLITFVSDKSLRKIFFIFSSLMLILFSFISLLNPTNTGSAIFAGAVGFGLLLFALSVKAKPNKDLFILSGFLIAISYLIRFESFLLNLGFFTVLFLFAHMVNCHKTFKPKDLLLPGLIFFSFLSINLIADSNNYSAKEWRDFNSLNDARHQIHARTAEYVLSDYLTKINWSESDYGMFRKFSLADPEKLNLESLNKALELTDFTRGVSALLEANYKNELIFINYSYSEFHWIIFLLFTLFLFIFFITKEKIKYLLTSLFISILGLSINFIFAVSYHLPDRLTFNFLFILFVGYLVFLLSININTVLSSRSIKAFSLILSLLFFLGFARLVPENIELRIGKNQDIQNIYTLQRNFIKEMDPEQRLIGTASNLIIQGQSPYKKFQPASASDQILILGWHNLSPIWRKNVTNLGLDSENFHMSVLDSTDNFIIEKSDAADLLLEFYGQYSINSIEILDTGFLGTDFYRIFKLKTAP